MNIMMECNNNTYISLERSTKQKIEIHSFQRQPGTYTYNHSLLFFNYQHLEYLSLVLNINSIFTLDPIKANYTFNNHIVTFEMKT